jgi:hypothetical protein
MVRVDVVGDHGRVAGDLLWVRRAAAGHPDSGGRPLARGGQRRRTRGARRQEAGEHAVARADAAAGEGYIARAVERDAVRDEHGTVRAKTCQHRLRALAMQRLGGGECVGPAWCSSSTSSASAPESVMSASTSARSPKVEK